MAAVDSPLSYLFKISIFCSKVIDFLDFFLQGASLALRSCFGTMMHKQSLRTMHVITAQNTREHVYNSRRRKAGRDSHIVFVIPPPTSPHPTPPTSQVGTTKKLALIPFQNIIRYFEIRHTYQSEIGTNIISVVKNASIQMENCTCTSI